MKKMMMTAAVILCVVGLIIIGGNDDSGTAPANQRDLQAIANRSDQDPASVIQKQDQEGNIYESNKAQLKKFVEAVYNNSGKKSKDLQSMLQGVAKDDVIREYDYQGEGVREAGEYETSVHHAKYTVNETMGIALFEIKTVTDLNENISLYLLQVYYDKGLISRVDRFTKIDE